jgi:multidrug resistance efflux pump
MNKARYRSTQALAETSSYVVWGVVSVIAMLVTVVPVQKAVRSDGNVWFEESKERTLFAPASGIIADVAAFEGQNVKKGQHIFKIETVDQSMEAGQGATMPSLPEMERFYGVSGHAEQGWVAASKDGAFIPLQGYDRPQIGKPVRYGEAVGYIVDNADFLFIANVSPSGIVDVAEGQPCDLKIWSSGRLGARVYTGRVVKVTQSFVQEREKGTYYRVWCSIDDPGGVRDSLRVGFSGRARIITGKENVLSLLLRRFR